MKATETYYENKIAKLEGRIDRLREVHRPVPGPYDNLVCDHCSHMSIHPDFHHDYPCRTIRIVEGLPE